MIKITDLRVDNWLIGKDGKPCQWTFGDFGCLDHYDIEGLINGGIPLTDELLIKCGFSYWPSKFTAKPELLTIQISNNETLDFEDGEFFIAGIAGHCACLLWKQPKFLHDLQNLFYFLTNDELKVNLNG